MTVLGGLQGDLVLSMRSWKRDVSGFPDLARPPRLYGAQVDVQVLISMIPGSSIPWCSGARAVGRFVQEGAEGDGHGLHVASP
jgi:hypothetical protein